jgi:hypothetical protein
MRDLRATKQFRMASNARFRLVMDWRGVWDDSATGLSGRFDILLAGVSGAANLEAEGTRGGAERPIVRGQFR